MLSQPFLKHFLKRSFKFLALTTTFLLLCLLSALSLTSCQGCTQTIETTKTEFKKVYITDDSVADLLAGGNAYISTNGTYFSNLYSKRLLITNFDFDPFVIRDVAGSIIGSNLQGDIYSLTTNSSGDVIGSNLAVQDVVLPPISVTNLIATNDQVAIVTQFSTAAVNTSDDYGYGLTSDDSYLYIPSYSNNVALYRISDYGFERWLFTNSNYFSNTINAVAVDSSNVYVLSEIQGVDKSSLKIFSKTNYAYLREITVSPKAQRLKQEGSYLFLGTVRTVDKSKRGFRTYFKSTLTKHPQAQYNFADGHANAVKANINHGFQDMTIRDTNNFFIVNGIAGSGDTFFGTLYDNGNFPWGQIGNSLGNRFILFPDPYYMHTPFCIVDDKQFIYLLDIERRDFQIFYFDENQVNLTYKHKFGSYLGAISNTNFNTNIEPRYLWAPENANLYYATEQDNRFYILSSSYRDISDYKYLTVLDKAILHYSITNTNTVNEERINHANWWGGYYPE